MTVLDNFGLLMRAHFVVIQTANAGASSATLIDENGTSRGLSVYGRHTTAKYNNQNRDSAQVGKGTTPATRQDEKIENPFTGGVESVKQLSAVAGYLIPQAKMEVQTLITPTLGSGIITEVVKFVRWQSGAVNFEFAIFRDVDPDFTPVGFIAGQSINLANEVFI